MVLYIYIFARARCVSDINDEGRSLGIIKPEILDYYYEKQEDMKKFTQQTLDGRLRVKVKDEFQYEPRIKYKCSECRIGRGFHDQQVLEWEVYQWMRKHPDNIDQVWENMGFQDPE